MVSFAQAVKAVLPHADANRMTPLLVGVRVTPGLVMATDRYTAGFANFGSYTEANRGAVEALEFEPFTMPLDTAKLVAKVKGDLHAVVRNGERGEVTLTFSSGESFKFWPVDGDYPPITNLVPSADAWTSATATETALAPKNLERFAARHLSAGPKDNTPVRLFLTGRKGTCKLVVATYGGWFTALVQPARMVTETAPMGANLTGRAPTVVA